MALELLAAAGPILPRIRGLVRIGERRWDIVLDRNQRILLPERAPLKALERMIALEQAQDLLARDIFTVDLRIDQRPVLRLAPFALSETRRANGIDTSGSDL
jgi:cell division protein FtsQ